MSMLKDMYAVMSNGMSTAKLLLDQGADVNAEDPAGITTLQRAETRSMIRVLKERGATGEANALEPMAFYLVDQEPKLIKSVGPVYPEEARRKGIQGSVFLKFIVGLDGKVRDIRLLKGEQMFVQAAKDAARQFEFIPASHQGERVEVWMTQPFRFNLN